ncbi:MAG: MBOAT family O-acyltransferase [Eubacteriales bacterium]
MVFSSLIFVFFFLPVVLFLHYLCPVKYRNGLLLCASIFFYCWGESHYFYLILLSIVMNFLLGLRIAECSGTERKIVLSLGVGLNLFILFLFKYQGFVANNFPSLFPNVGNMGLILPLGISFFTFQAISYLIDVFRETVPPQKNLISLGLYISFFPQLVAGPIVRYTTFSAQIEERKTSYAKTNQGVCRFVQGFCKKVIFANQFSIIALASFGAESPSFALAWLGGIAYSLQIYFDFSGYSDMAIGLGKMFGFDFLENFNYPYISRSISEFWRRWHISLGSWFRDYVYFPMGGSRVGKIQLVFNLGLVWFLTGFWHGAAWQFLIWGMMYFVLILMERLFSVEKYLENFFLSGIYRVFVLVVTVSGWVIFGEDSFTGGLSHLKQMFVIGEIGDIFYFEDAIRYFRNYGVLLWMGVLCATPFFPWIWGKISLWLREKTGAMEAQYLLLEEYVKSLGYMFFFIVSVSYLVINSHNPFIYFNF